MDLKKIGLIGLIIMGMAAIWALMIKDVLSNQGNRRVKNYYQAKAYYLPVIWGENAKTFYCGCSMTEKWINAKSCGYEAKNDSRRSKVREWEHIVPASRFGALIQECRGVKPRRACLRKKSEIFNRMEADLHNLVPAVGSLNAARRNFSFGIIPGEIRDYGDCDFELKNGIVEPRESVRGDIARAYLYMAKAYPGYVYLTAAEKIKFDAWNKLDPPSAEERSSNRKIEEIQGNGNPFIGDR